jgi:hypothetical protein
VSDWYTGASPNHGVVFIHPTAGRTNIGGSEAPTPGPRPVLTVCYEPDPCGGVVCPPPGECQSAGLCDSSTGQCNYGPAPDGTACSGGSCQAGSCVPNGGSCDPNVTCGCFEDWLVGTPCNGTDYGNGCSPADTGYHFKGIFDGYACFWHQKNQAWNTTPASNYYHLEQHFGITPGVFGAGRVSWCHDKNAIPTPLSYSSVDYYFDPNDVGSWGWCAESDPNSGGFVCIPTEGTPICQ